ncbi:hypothetical protein E2C01_059597 [Portunus trituberculatus]|uniref:Uncharacterized protein n=1 Tax=Portunus trituberculatus TaxID=210409 RepID=A0A5B7H9H5_PORTR|nr:hypothetical protein [Portunus trituberculatus]
MCSTEDRCCECSHLSLLQFQVFVKDAEKHSGGSSEKRSRWQEPASETPWVSRFVAVESDLAAMKASIAQLSTILLPPASGSTFSGFADGGVECVSVPQVSARCKGALVYPWLRPFGGASLSLPGLAPGVPPWPVDVGTDSGGAVVSQAAAMGWPSFSEEVDEVFDDIPSGEAGTPDEEGVASYHWSRTHLRDFTAWRHPLGLEVRREHLGCSLGILNLASAKFALPRRFWGPLLDFPVLPPQRGLDCLGALARANLDIMQPCVMLRLRMMMLRKQAVIAHGLASTGLRLVVPLVPNTLRRLCLLRFHPLLLLR